MNLSLLTYNMARSWALPKVIEVARAGGFAACEFRAEANHNHGVELEATAAQRHAIQNQMEDAYLAIACIGTSSRFESPDPRQRREVIERTKRYVELAADLACGRVRVFGNDMPAGEGAPNRADVVRYVGDSLRELGEFADPYGVDVLLEMHGQFNFWGFARGAVEHATHPRVGIVYNCDRRDIVAGSVAGTYGQVRRHIRHVHLHEFTRPFPYPELFALLWRDGYEGYLSSEHEQEVPPPEEFLLLYANLFRAWLALAAAGAARGADGGVPAAGRGLVAPL